METGETVIHLRSLSERGLVTLDPGPFGGWGVTESGRITDEELARNELAAVDGRVDVLKVVRILPRAQLLRSWILAVTGRCEGSAARRC